MKNGGGHFAPKLGGHFELESGGQYHWNLQAELKKENQRLKVMIADLVLRYDIVKKSLDMLD